VTNSDQWLILQFSWYAPGFWLLLSSAVTLVLCLFWGMLSPNTQDAILLIRFLAVPYTGLLLGGLSPRFMGLNGLDWLVSFSIGIGLILVMLLALTLARITVAVANPLNYSAAQLPGDPINAPVETIGDRQPALFTPAIYQIYRSGAEEFHWSFLRGATWEILLALPVLPALPIYWAIWGAALLAMPDILLTGRTLLHRLLKIVILITTAILFLYTRNFWLCWVLHTAGWSILASGFGTPGRMATPVAASTSKLARKL
jgi:hypothetical protein